MYVEISERVGFVPGGTNVGIIRHEDGRVTLIDSGLNDTTARKVLRVVRDDLKAEVVSIVNTHGHADHFGANAFVHKRTGCEVWAPPVEASVIANPLLQPAMLFGGADPMEALRNKFLLAEPCPVTGEIPLGSWTHFGTELTIVPLGGHAPNQVGIAIDGAFFCADVVFPETAIEKYRIPYLFGLTEHLASLEAAGSVPTKRVIPGHGEAPESIEALVALNRAAIERTIDGLLSVLDRPRTGDEVAGAVFLLLDVPVTDAQSYFLLRPTISAYLAHMERTGAITSHVADGRFLWARA